MSLLYSLETISHFFSGRIIEIAAGCEGRRYHIHAEALSRSESPSLRALVSERWNQSTNMVIDWSHVDAATTERFFTYLYTGRYLIPAPDLLPHTSTHSIESVIDPPEVPGRSALQEFDVEEQSQPDEIEPEPEPGFETEEEIEPETHIAAQVSPTDTPINVLENDPSFQAALLNSLSGRPLTPLSLLREPDPAVASTFTHCLLDHIKYPYLTHTYREPMLALARLYCFSVYHLCPPLQSSTLNQMICILEQVDCSQSHAPSELADLVQYVYENTSVLIGGTDRMRKLISHFVVANYTCLMSDEMEDFFTKGGDFALDVAQKLRRRVLAMDQSEELWQVKLNRKEKKLRIVQDELATAQAKAAARKRCRV